VRWKLLRRRLSISSPHMIVRSRVPWPLRWAFIAMTFGFSAAIALWAFDLGKDIAGVDRDGRDELATLRKEVAVLRSEREASRSITDTADSLLKASQAAQEKLAQQLRQAESENMSLRADLGFFERLLPASGTGLNLRGLQAVATTPGKLRYQLLLMQGGRAGAFSGRYHVRLAGTRDGQPWTLEPSDGDKRLQFRHYARVEGHVEHPVDVVVKTVQVNVVDNNGGVLATQSVEL
jgi:hypothetical protein